MLNIYIIIEKKKDFIRFSIDFVVQSASAGRKRKIEYQGVVVCSKSHTQKVTVVEVASIIIIMAL